MRWLAGVVGVAVVVALLAIFVSSGLGSASRVSWIAYIRHDDVYVIDPATGETHRLTHGHATRWPAGLAGDLSVSPDGSEVAYTVPFSGKGRYRYARTIDVRSVSGGTVRDVTPWNSVGWGGQTQSEPRHIDPHWVDWAHLDYTDDLASNGHSWGIAMTVEVTNGRHAHARVPRPVKHEVLEPFVAAGRYTAYPVLLPRGYECASTLDLARAAGSTQLRLSHTPLDGEEPVDIDAAGDVLAIRSWVVSGAHNGLCLLHGTGTRAYELVVFGGDGTTRVLQRYPDIKVSLSSSLRTLMRHGARTARRSPTPIPRGVSW